MSKEAEELEKIRKILAMIAGKVGDEPIDLYEYY